MKRYIAILAMAFMALFLNPSQASALSRGGLTINSWSISSIHPVSFTSVDAKIKLNVTNDRKKVTMTEISGIIYGKNGETFIIGTVDDIAFKHGTADVVLSGHGSLASYSAMLSLLSNLSLNPADYTANINVTYKRGRLGEARTVQMKKVPLSTFIK